ncbi:PH domain-containing protein [Virgibacillus halophilus]|uniref:PH domain-containing protein n=1 Tax=Tigheibacillus halophilus TaxID=361280 RepID=A0ABU5C8I9_9BACI|nr:PH domain-containing protein [Virgibacillus halophilus]
MFLFFLVSFFSFSLTAFGVIVGIIGLMAIGFLLWIWFGTGYRIENKVIKIKNGPFRWEIAIQDINSIGKTKSLMATPALSVDRLALRYGKYGEMLLSPKNEKVFIEMLLAKNPQIKLVGKTS